MSVQRYSLQGQLQHSHHSRRAHQSHEAKPTLHASSLSGQTAWQSTAMHIKLLATFQVACTVVLTCQRQRRPAPALVPLAAAPIPFWTCWQGAQLAQQQQPQTHCCHRPCQHHPLCPTCPSAAVSTSTIWWFHHTIFLHIPSILRSVSHSNSQRVSRFTHVFLKVHVPISKDSIAASTILYFQCHTGSECERLLIVTRSSTQYTDKGQY